MKALLLKHIPRDGRNATHGRLTRHTRRLLETGLDGIDGRVAQGPHGAADQADDHGLVAGQLGVVVGRLPALQAVLEVRVGGEVDGLVGALAQGGQRHAAVEGAHAFFFEHRVQGVCGVAVFRDVERVGHAVVLRLQADFDYFHGCHDGDGFGDTGGKTGWEVRRRGLVRVFNWRKVGGVGEREGRSDTEESSSAAHGASVFVGEELLVGFVGGEADGHLRHDARDDGS